MGGRGRELPAESTAHLSSKMKGESGGGGWCRVFSMSLNDWMTISTQHMINVRGHPYSGTVGKLPFC